MIKYEYPNINPTPLASEKFTEEEKKNNNIAKINPKMKKKGLNGGQKIDNPRPSMNPIQNSNQVNMSS